MRLLVPLLRQAVRTFARHPGFAAIAVATLAVGMGATTAIVSVVNAVLLRPLPYANPDRLVVLSETRRGDEVSIAFPNLLDWRERSHTLGQIAAFAGRTLNLTGDGDPERLRGQAVTANLFDILGVQPTLGRAFGPEADRAGTERTVVLSYTLWQRRFGGDRGILGRSIRLHDEPYTVIGVMPSGFDFPGGIVYGPAEFWVPAGLMAREWADRDEHPGIVGIARLAPGATLGSARREMDQIAAAMSQEYAENRDQGVMLRTALDSLVGDYRSSLLLLLGAVVLVLLIATANVTNLLLVRAAGRQHEIAVRQALGAGRRHLLAQLTVESLALSAAGAAAGVALAWIGTRAATGLLTGLPRGGITVLDWRVLLAALALSVLAGLAGGLAPALGTRTGVSSISLRSRDAGPRAGRLRSGLAMVETSLALMLLISAAVVLRSFARIQKDQGGIDPTGTLVWQTTLPESRYGEGEPTVRFYREAFERIAAIPGVESVGGISVLPFSGSGNQSGMMPGDRHLGETLRTDVAAVTPGYFEAMGVRLLRGRFITAEDQAGGPVAGVVDEQLAEAMWPGEDPIGKTLTGWGFESITVVGLVAHVKNYGVTAESRAELFVPHAQRAYSRMWGVARTRGNPDDLARAVRAALAQLDASLPVYSVQPMQGVVDGTTARPRMAATLSTAFAAIALGLAMIGLYGVLAYSVAQRTRELGIRLALGATPAGVMGLVLRQALVIVGIGTAVGLLGAFGTVRLLGGLAYGVEPADPRLFAAAAGAFLLVTLAAAAAPARRAARVAPLEALREE